jgi:RNA polymerase sigma-70 factor (ECF subfamily)
VTKDFSDSQILQILKAEGPELKSAFDSFYLRHSHRIYKYALSKSLSPELAGEAVQIVFWKIFEKRQQYKQQYEPLQWLFVIARSEIKDLRNREKTQTQGRVTDPQESLSQMAAPSPIPQEAEDFRVLIQDLDARTQELLVKRFVEDLDYQEMSVLMDETEVNLRKLFSRALRKLKKGVSP